MSAKRHCWTCTHCPKPGECRGFTMNRVKDDAREVWVARTHVRGAQMPPIHNDGGGCPAWAVRGDVPPERLPGEFRERSPNEEDRYAQQFIEQVA